MLDFLKEKLLPAAFVALASAYLFTIGVFDELGIDATPSIQLAAIFVFRTTFDTFARAIF